MNVEIGTVTRIFLFWEYLFQIFGILSLQCSEYADSPIIQLAGHACALQMKGWWESIINVWFPFTYFQKWNCAASLFPKQNYNVLYPNSYTLIYLWEIYIFSGSVCPFRCSQIWGPILGIYKLLTGTWMWKLGLRPCNSQKRNTQMGFFAAVRC